MYISGVIYDSVVDGLGVRNTLFVSGCIHACEGCFNPDTWDFKYGEFFSEEKQNEFILKCRENPMLKGLTLSGGDPMCSAKELIPFVRRYKQMNPKHDIWCYTGYRYEDLKGYQLDLLKEIDILVDSPYDKVCSSKVIKFRGSTNQRIIDVKSSLLQDKIVELDL